MDLSVEDGLVLTPDGVVEADVGVQDGRIEEVGSVEDADRRLDAGGCVVVPGLVNAHTHASMSLLRGYADDLPLDVWLEDHIWPVESQLTADDVETGARLAAAEMVAGGTTAFADMYFHMDRVAAAVDDAGLRATLGYGVITAGKTKEEARRELREGVEFAVEHDGAADGRVSTMLCPHAPYTCDDESLEEAARLAREHGLRLHVHLSETASEVEDSVEDNGVRPPEHLDSLGFFDGDVYVAHGVHLDADDRGLLAERDVGVAHCPSANAKLASGVAPVTEMLDAGVDVAIGTDGPASNNDLDVLEETRLAALLAKLETGDASALPAETALEIATEGGAGLLGLDSGAIEPGRPADLAVVDLDSPHLTPAHDVVSHLVYSASAADVVHTVVDGRVLYEDGVHLSLDVDDVVSRANDAAAALVERAEAEGS